MYDATKRPRTDIGFVDTAEPRKGRGYHLPKVLVPGVLNPEPYADKDSVAWLELGVYAKAVLWTQVSRRFVLGFTMCGSLMRAWAFDQLGGIASEQFDINQNGLRFVSTMLAFLGMVEDQLGFDPTITTEAGRRLVTITRNG
jgi:hypothetical protein